MITVPPEQKYIKPGAPPAGLALMTSELEASGGVTFSFAASEHGSWTSFQLIGM
jgi:hypothetical protein